MSRKKNTTISQDYLDSVFLFFTIVALIITNFIVRLKMFSNIRAFDMKIITSTPNFFTYYKLIWVMCVLTILILFTIYKISKNKQVIKLNFVLLGSGLIIIASIVAYALDPLKVVSVFGLFSRNNGLLAYVSLFLLIYLISLLKVNLKHISFLVHTLNITSIIFIIIAIFQFFGLDITNSLWYKQIYVPGEYKYLIESIKVSSMPFIHTKYFTAPSIFGQINYFGAYCSIIFTIITVFALYEETPIKKISLIIGSIMLFVGTILAHSMGSILAMLIIIFIITVFVVNKYNYKRFLVMMVSYIIMSQIINKLTNGLAFSEIYTILLKLLNSKVAYLMLLTLIMIILFCTFKKKILKYRYHLVSIFIIISIVISSIAYIFILNNIVESNMEILSNRGYIWRYSHELVKKNPVFGYGPDNLYYNFPQLNADKSKYMPNDLIDKPHNMYLQILLDTGVFGLIGFMILLIVMLLKLNRGIDEENNTYKTTYFKALMLAIMVYMIQGIVNDNTIATQSVLNLMIGMGASLTNNIRLLKKSSN